MDYHLLIQDLTAGFNNFRRGAVRSTFDRLDYLDSGKFDIRILKELFNSRNHFDVKNGRKTSEEVISEFFACLNCFVRSLKGSGEVGSESFLDFWRQISPNIDNDYNFESLLKNCFRYNELPRKNKLNPPTSSSQQHQTPIYDNERYHPQDSIKYTMFPSSDRNLSENYIYNIFDHLRNQLAKRGPKGFMMMYRSFKCNDFDGDGKLSCKEFIKSLHEIRVELLDKETINVFKVFDPSNSGFISISEFMSSFIPELSPARQQVVDELLDGLSGGGQRITYKTIKKVYYPRGHPDFTSGKRADYEIKEEFFLMLNTFLSLSGGINDFIPRDLMLQFFEIFSYAFEDDRYFNLILKGTFRMNKLSYPPVDYSTTSDAYSVRAESRTPYGTNADVGHSPAKSGGRGSGKKVGNFIVHAPPSPDPSPLGRRDPNQQSTPGKGIAGIGGFGKREDLAERAATGKIPQVPDSPPQINEDSKASPSVDMVIAKVRQL